MRKITFVVFGGKCNYYFFLNLIKGGKKSEFHHPEYLKSIFHLWCVKMGQSFVFTAQALHIFFLVCVCCTCVCIHFLHVYGDVHHTHLYTHMRRPAINARDHSQSLFHLFHWGRVLQSDPELKVISSPASQLALGIFCPVFQDCNYRQAKCPSSMDMSSRDRGAKWGAPVLELADQAFQWQSRLPPAPPSLLYQVSAILSSISDAVYSSVKNM